MTELEQEAVEFMKKHPKDPEGHLVYEVMAKFAEFKLKQLSVSGNGPEPSKEECLYGPVGKHIFHPHDDEPRRCVNCGAHSTPKVEEK